MKHLICAAMLAALGLTMVSGQAPARKITFNGKNLTQDQTAVMNRLEQVAGVRLPDGACWYDNRSGAMGMWNGPAAAILPAGLGWGGAMPANCSGGLTTVFVNGRALHPMDVASLSQFGPVYPGRYWLDAQGYYGFEGGPALGNLIAAASQAGARSQQQHRTFSDSELGVIINPAGA